MFLTFLDSEFKREEREPRVHANDNTFAPARRPVTRKRIFLQMLQMKLMAGRARLPGGPASGTSRRQGVHVLDGYPAPPKIEPAAGLGMIEALAKSYDSLNFRQFPGPGILRPE